MNYELIYVLLVKDDEATIPTGQAKRDRFIADRAIANEIAHPSLTLRRN